MAGEGCGAPAGGGWFRQGYFIKITSFLILLFLFVKDSLKLLGGQRI